MLKKVTLLLVVGCLVLSAFGQAPLPGPSAFSPSFQPPIMSPPGVDQEVALLLSRILAWQSKPSLIHSGGLLEGDFAETIGLVPGAGATGRTFIQHSYKQRIRQSGWVKQIKVGIFQQGIASQRIKFKVFRPNGANYDMVAETAQLTVAGTGTRIYNLSPWLSCQQGDVIGIWTSFTGTALEQIKIGATEYPGSAVRASFTNGDITTSDAFATLLTDTWGMDIEALTTIPYLIGTGDSILAHDWSTHYDVNGPGGTVSLDIQHQVRGLVGSGGLLEIQNFAMGGSRISWIVSTSIADVIAVGPRVILIHTGVNDVNNGDEWADIEGDYDSIKAAVPAGQILLVDEILPWTNGDDTEVATVRDINANLAIWCPANGAILVRCHDAMGQIRPSTGQLDDLKTAYNHDGVHLNQAGVNAMARIVFSYLLSVGMARLEEPIFDFSPRKWLAKVIPFPVKKPVEKTWRKAA